MRIIEARKVEWERRDRHHTAPSMDGIMESVRLIDADTGEILAFQTKLPEKYDQLRRDLVRFLRFSVAYQGKITSKNATSTTNRLSGVTYEHRNFGFTAPQPLRRRYAISPSMLNFEEPEAYRMLQELTKACWGTFMEQAPDAAKAHLDLVDGHIHPDWLIAGMPFTSGIINNTAALPYHKDSGNIKGTWNNMVALRRNVEGGCLHLPEYNVTLGIPDGSISGFDGQGAWHGVTPFVKTRPDAYRFTIVWYTKTAMLNSGSREEEAQKAKQKATPADVEG